MDFGTGAGRGPETSPPWISRDNWCFGGVRSYIWILNFMGWVSASNPWIVQGSAVLLYSCLLTSIFEVETSFLSLTIICLEVIYRFFKDFTLGFDHYDMSRCISLYLLCLSVCGSFESMVSFSNSEKSSAIISSILSQLHPPSPPPVGLQWNVCWTFSLCPTCCKSTLLCFP